MSLADTTTVSNLMRTSSTLHREGTSFLLRDVVDLKSGLQVTSFRSFMKDGSTHLRSVSLLHSLQLSMATISSTAAISLEHLFGCLNTCGKLERLHLFYTEVILSASAGMVAAVSRLTTLKEVVLLNSGYCCVALLRCLCSRFTAACIEFDGEDQERILDPHDPYPFNTRDPIQLLSHSRDTLTTLYVGTPGHSSPDGPVYPSLRELNIEHGPPPVLSNLTRAFPNLTSIHFPDATPERLELAAVDLCRHREMNIAHQFSHASWSSLDEIEAEEILLLYLLALQCPVRVLRTEIHYENDVDLLAEVLTDLTPEVLELRIDEAYMINTDTGIVDALCEARDPQITELRLFVEFQCRDVALDVDAFMSTMLLIARSLEMSQLLLHLECKFLSHQSCELDDTGQSCPLKGEYRGWKGLYPVEIALEELDLEAIAWRIMATGPSLKTVEIRMVNSRTDLDKIAVVHSSGSSSSLDPNSRTA